jgi:hypothetical protein
MELLEIKMILADRVCESDLSDKDKVKLITYLENANELQTKHLLLNGTMVDHVSEKDAVQINLLFESDAVQKKLQEGVLKTVFGMFLLSPPGWVVYRGVRAMFSKASRKCGALSIGSQRDLCLLRAKVQKFEKLINLVKREMKNCSQAKNPDKCKQSGRDKLEKWESELKMVKGRISDIRGSGSSVVG